MRVLARLAAWRRCYLLVAGGEQFQFGAAGLGLRGEIVLLAQAAVDAAGDQGSGGSDDLAGAGPGGNGLGRFGVRFVGGGDGPCYGGKGGAARSRFAERAFGASA